MLELNRTGHALQSQDVKIVLTEGKNAIRSKKRVLMGRLEVAVYRPLGVEPVTEKAISPIFVLIIRPIAIAYSMGQIIKSFCVCPCVCVCVRLWTLTRSHFFVDFHQIGHRRVNPQK